jgi:hypothetical protein
MLGEHLIDQKIAAALRQIAACTRDCSRAEDGSSTLGYAAIGRYVPKNGELTQVGRTRLMPGEGVIFMQNGMTIGFEVANMAEALRQHASLPDFETVAYVDCITGSLFFGRGETHTIIGVNTPADNRILNATIGNAEYGAIWGESQAEVENTLTGLIMQKHLN